MIDLTILKYEIMSYQNNLAEAFGWIDRSLIRSKTEINLQLTIILCHLARRVRQKSNCKLFSKLYCNQFVGKIMNSLLNFLLLF